MTVTTENANVAGWPRPRLPFKGGTIPAPWVARMDWRGENVDPAAFDYRRVDAVMRDWLCQVCGAQCDRERSFAAITPEDFHSADSAPYGIEKDCYSVSGGPVCSERCIRLARTYCPHLAANSTRVVTFSEANCLTWSPDCSGQSLLIWQWDAA